MPRRTRPIALLAVAGLLIAVGLLAQSYGGRVTLRDDSVRGCLRGQQDRREQVRTNGDLERFALNAAQARLDSGELDVALQYTAIANHARARNRRIVQRLPPVLSCTDAFPAPSVVPWAG